MVCPHCRKVATVDLTRDLEKNMLTFHSEKYFEEYKKAEVSENDES